MKKQGRTFATVSGTQLPPPVAATRSNERTGRMGSSFIGTLIDAIKHVVVTGLPKGVNRMPENLDRPPTRASFRLAGGRQLRPAPM